MNNTTIHSWNSVDGGTVKALAQPVQPARIQGLMEIILEAAAIINAIDPAYAPANIRWPIVDELDGFSLMLASTQKAQP